MPYAKTKVVNLIRENFLWLDPHVQLQIINSGAHLRQCI